MANPIERRVEWPAALAVSVAYAVPGVLGVLSLRCRPLLALAGGVLGIALGLTAMSGVSIVLWLPSFLLFASYSAWTDKPRSRVPAAVMALVAFALGSGAFVASVASRHQVCWSYTTDLAGHTTYTRVAPIYGNMGFSSPGIAESGGGCSDAGTTGSALVSLALVALALSACWWLSAPPAAER